MPYANNDGVKIYYEVIGKGPPIMLVDGLTGSIEIWERFGYVQPLSEKYTLLLVDPRGRGKSDKPHKPEEHSMELMVADLVAVLDDLNLDQVIYWGYSTGGRIGLAIGKYAPERFNALVIGGNGLIEKDSQKEIDDLKTYLIRFDQEQELINKYEKEGWPKDFEGWKKEKWLTTDYDALRAYCSFYENIGMKDYLPRVTIPTLVYAGTEDRIYQEAKHCARVIPNAEFVSFQGMNHGDPFYKIEEVFPHVIKFLQKVTLSMRERTYTRG
jgi:pimeloyl-ACP methyl ester carboxylesterase